MTLRTPPRRQVRRVRREIIDIGLCILPIHDGFITTERDVNTLEMFMNEAFQEIIGRTAKIKPEAFDL